MYIVPLFDWIIFLYLKHDSSSSSHFSNKIICSGMEYALEWKLDYIIVLDCVWAIQAVYVHCSCFNCL